MSVRNLDKLFKPGSVALIGATPRPARSARSSRATCARAGFAGRADAGQPASPDDRRAAGLSRRREPAAGARPRGHRHAARDRAWADRRARRARHARRGRHHRRLRRAGRARPRACSRRRSTRRGPICCASSGPIASASWCPAIGLDASFSHIAPPAGDLAFVSQSGAMITAMLDWAAPRGIGFSHVVSLGDMADVDFGDMLDYLAADPRHPRDPALCRGHHPCAANSCRRRAPRRAPSRSWWSRSGASPKRRARPRLAYRRARRLRRGLRRRVPPRRHAARRHHGRAVRRRRDAGADRRSRRRAAAILTNGGGAGRARDRCADRRGRPARRAVAATPSRGSTACCRATWSRGNPVDIIGDAAGARYADALEVLLGDRDDRRDAGAQLPDRARRPPRRRRAR